MIFFLWGGLIHFFKVKANIFLDLRAQLSPEFFLKFEFWAQLSLGPVDPSPIVCGPNCPGPIVRVQLARAQFAGYRFKWKHSICWDFSFSIPFAQGQHKSKITKRQTNQNTKRNRPYGNQATQVA